MKICTRYLKLHSNQNITVHFSRSIKHNLPAYVYEQKLKRDAQRDL
jgi:hypothetical protein